MVLKILLIISIVLQLIAAAIAIRLTRVTKYNLSWILITIALTIMTFQRFGEFMQVAYGKIFTVAPEVYVWAGVITSLCFAAGVFLVRKILTYISTIEQKRRIYEKRILNVNIRAEEKERRRISEEIHDGLGPLLSSVKMSVSALAKMNKDPKQAVIIENTNIVVDEAIKCIREVSNNLNPHVLSNFGVARALTGFINKMSLFSDVKIKFDTNLKDIRFDANVEIILYRVICELINNTMKHARATEITLGLICRDEDIFVNFEDNGIGFDTEKALEGTGSGIGLSNIISRLESIKGHMEIYGRPEGGTAVVIHINMRQ